MATPVEHLSRVHAWQNPLRVDAVLDAVQVLGIAVVQDGAEFEPVASVRAVAGAKCVLVVRCKLDKAIKRVLLVEVSDFEQRGLATDNCLVEGLCGEPLHWNGGGCAADFVARLTGDARGAVLSEWGGKG